MIWDIILLIILVVWIVIYLKNKKVILSLPYLLMIFLTPIYNILDQKSLSKYLDVDVCLLLKLICLT